MGYFFRRISTAVAITATALAIGLYAVNAQQAGAKDQQQQQSALNANIAGDASLPQHLDLGIARTETKQNGHRHHHHHRKGGRRNPGRPHPGHKYHGPLRQISLVCDGLVVDHIMCKIRHPLDPKTPQDEDRKGTSSPIIAQNNGGKVVEQAFVVMDRPCSKDIPPSCLKPADAASVQEDYSTEESVIGEESDLEGADPTEYLNESELADKDDEALQTHELFKRHGNRHGKHPRHPKRSKHAKHDDHDKNCKHNHPDQHKPPAKSTRPSKPGNLGPPRPGKPERSGKRNLHPHKDLCVALGDFCGSQLYGCNFKPNALYRCTEIGKKPELVKICTDGAGCLIEKNGRSKCDSKCELQKPVCGSELHKSLKAEPNTIYFCQNGKVGVLQICLPGTGCIPQSGGKDPICGFDTCSCNGKGQFCSNQFPQGCTAEQNAIYECNGSDPPKLVKKCDGKKECVAFNDGAQCATTDCKCPRDGLLCGDVFLSSCRYSAVGLYKCKKGEAPVLEKSCLPGRCAGSQASLSAGSVFKDNECMNACLCTSPGPVCGSTFPTSCKLQDDSLYRCDGKGSSPFPIKTCQNGCLIMAGDNGCKGDPRTIPKVDCYCPGPGTGPICGYDLPAACNADPNTIYVCPSGPGTLPVASELCKPGLQCQPRSLPTGAVCGASTCECSGSNEICGRSFPDSCGLDKESIYKCTSDGKANLVKKCDGSSECDGTDCAPKDCKCPRDGDVCGEAFPRSCKFLAAALYSCKKGESPVLQQSCYPDRCVLGKMDTKCTDSCKCTESGNVCGSTFPPKCGFLPSTLYKCNGQDQSPVSTKACLNGCKVNPGDDSCSEEECTCPGLGFNPVCGSDLPASCNAHRNTIYSCPGGHGTKPVPLELCRQGTECFKEPLPEGASCGGSTCDCQGDVSVCGSSFPSSCGYQKNAIYKCAANGQAEIVKNCTATQDCVWLTDAATCVDGDCKCPANGDVCGEVFPLRCRLSRTMVYTCKKGEIPVASKECYPNRCSSSKAALDAAIAFGKPLAETCTDSCKCIAKGTFCGSTFPPKCHYEFSTLYECDGPGGNPMSSEVCEPGGCTVNVGHDTCSKDPCTCPDLTPVPVCGLSLPPSCKADPNTIYICYGSHGTKPEPVKICDPGSVCLKKPSPMGATCGSNTCECKGDHDLCSDGLPKTCNVPANSIYRCGGNGDLALVKQCDSTESCVVRSGEAECASLDCKCPSDGAICGEAFPLSCKLKATALYQCKKGDNPKFVSQCFPGRCGTNGKETEEKCQDSCKCQEAGQVCDSTFPQRCNLAANTLYTCSGEDSDPVLLEKCTKGCNVNAGDDSCVPSNICVCTDTQDVCGSAFPASCNLETGSLYSCAKGPGGSPVLSKKCPNQKCNVTPGNDQCEPGPCECKNNEDSCGSAFPDSCGLDKNTLYKCSYIGSNPIQGVKCESGNCLVQSTDDICLPVQKNCKCWSSNSACGNVFGPSCNLSSNTLYTCSGEGATPKPAVDCKYGCRAFPGFPDTCTADPCACQGPGPICGSVFPDSCGLDKETLFQCSGRGAKPDAGKKCESGKCLVQLFADACKPVPPSDCKCINAHSVCGKAFASNCNLRPETLYTCSAPGAEPSSSGNCKFGCSVISNGSDICTSDPCACFDNTPTCGSAFPDYCLLNGTTLYQCPEYGVRPTVGEPCASGECFVQPNQDVCKPFPPNTCKCTESTLVCGKTFDSSCDLLPEALYSCLGKGADPLLSADCGLGCSVVVDGPDTCSSDPCACKELGPTCGSNFPSSCGLDRETLFQCNAKNFKPKNGEICATGVCLVQPIDDICKPIPPSNCKCIHSDDVCGKVFDPQCHFLPDVLYTCTGPGATPVPGFECKFGCSIAANGINDICIPDPCTCNNKDPVCGSAFPGSCMFDKGTLYRCAGAGSIPSNGKVCDLNLCKVQPGPDVCTPPPEDPCLCKNGYATCGSAFNDKCGYDKSTLYQCTMKGTKPQLGVKCQSGECIVQSIADVCKPLPPDNCKCTDGTNVCGKVYDSKCGFQPETLYSCSGAGAVPRYASACQFGCSVIASGEDICTPDPCACKDTDPICGSELPASCSFEPSKLYQCPGRNLRPTSGVSCDSGICLAQSGPDVCKPIPPDNCKCKDNIQICGNTFEKKCNLKPDTLYTCSGPGTDPKSTADCQFGCSVTVGITNDTCAPDPCACVDGDAVCGFVLPDICKLDRATLYQCSGKGGKPGSGIKCESTTCVSLPGPDFCHPLPVDPCVCENGRPTCGSSFPDSCGLDKVALYSCSGKGAKPSNGTKCESGLCLVQSFGDVCKPTTPNTCSCVDNAAVCGKAYDPSCNLRADTLYICSKPGATLQPSTDCKHGCSVIAGSSDECAPDPCSCTGTKPTCGSTFPDFCLLDAKSVYQCPIKGAPPQSPTRCESGECLAQPAADVCKPVPQNTCKCTDNTLVCGKVFDAQCSLKPDTLYSCIRLGAGPIPGPDCQYGCTVVANGRDTCAPNPCACSDSNPACGSVFPESCGLDKDTLYQCSGVGALPSAGQKCQSSVCLTQANGGICKPLPPDNCKCTDTFEVCGKLYELTCGFKPNTLYSCSGVGAVPQPKNDCQSGCTVVLGSNDFCAPDPCSCQDSETVCGSVFPSTCGLDANTLYNCSSKGALPSQGFKCESNVCIVQEGPDACKPEVDPCVCVGTYLSCGSSFPKSCGYDNSTLYQCPGANKKPINGVKCASGECIVQATDDVCKPIPPDHCKCTEAMNVCGKVFDSKCSLKPETLYTCAGDGATPTLSTDCKFGCLVITDAADICAPDPCLCPDGDSRCGSAFPAICELDAATLFQCSARGAQPTNGLRCLSGQCDELAGPDACHPLIGPPNPCVCNDTDPVCGSVFPAKCNLDASTLYQCPAKDAEPKSGVKCESNECLVQTGADVCKPKPPDTCKCKDNMAVCGKVFDSKCNLGADTLYTCPGAGLNPQLLSECNFGCTVVTDNSDVCAPDPCKCKDSDNACGSTFPVSCGLIPTGLYTCAGIGSNPAYKTTCSIGCQVLPGPDDCVHMSIPCHCATKEDTCGAALIGSCSVEANTLYDCSGSTPAVKEKCASNKCIVQDGNDVCEPVCSCTGDQNQCSTSFDAVCKLPPVAVYKCTNGKPEQVQLCQGDEICKPNASGAECIKPDCLCKDNNKHCGSDFLAACGYDSNTLYQCTTGEKPTVVQQCVSPKVCKTLSAGPQCIFPDCSCKDNNKHCSSDFPAICGLVSNTVYQCSNGENPTVVQGCTSPEVCKSLTTGDQCINPDCLCKDANKHCGADFPAVCNLDNSTLYQCSTGEKPTSSQKCVSPEVCKSLATGDQCINPDCLCKDNNKHCGADFPAVCNLDNSTLYQCSTGEKPTIAQGCTSPEVCKSLATGDQCINPDCLCKDNIKHCGADFPAVCNLDNSALYQCSTGEKPTSSQQCVSPEVCKSLATGDQCINPDCLCKDNNKHCGADFPAVCNLDNSTLYQCSTGEKPTVAQGCISPEVCKSLATGDQCINPDCLCKDNNKHCGADFPAVCNLDSSTLYQCSTGEKPTSSQKCVSPEVCKSLATGDQCINPDCLCKDNNKHCGADFPAVCNLDNSTLYQCSTGEKPTSSQKCVSPEVCKSLATGDQCINPDCLCKDNNKHCGADFPAVCNLDNSTLYQCSTGEKPTIAQGCISPEVCKSLATGDQCINPDCLCKDNNKHCGAEFPAVCNPDSSTLYQCSTGEKPTSSQQCVSPEVCKSLATGAQCINPDCLCKDTNKHCGADFPAVCNLDNSTLYQCSTGEKPTIAQGCTSPEVCKSLATGDQCINPDCLCKDNNKHCGAEFPAVCNLDSSTLYQCSTGEKPTSSQQCVSPEVCKSLTTGAQCINPDCLCKDGYERCGVVFPSFCGLSNNSLYQCTNGEKPAAPQDCGTGTCSANLQPVTSPLPQKDDFCVGLCKCKSTENVCASTFDSSCGYGSGHLKSCSAIGAQPNLLELCTLSCEILPGPDKCKFDPCACRKGMLSCGSSFPANCSYEPNTLYNCAAPNKLPTKNSPCKNNETCTMVQGDNDVCGPSNTCKCKGTGGVCGELFQPACSFSVDSVIQCPAGTTQTCPFGCANGCCQSNCKCPSNGAKCGSSFADKCNLLPNALYSCTAGGDPVLLNDCGNQACVQSSSDHSCADPCKCKGNTNVCSSTFPTSCGYANSALYSCNGVGATPAKLELCAGGCLFTNPNHTCRLDCYKEIGEVNTPIDNTLAALKTITDILGSDPMGNLVTKNLTATKNITGPIAAIYPLIKDALTNAKTLISQNPEDPDALSSDAVNLLETTKGFMIVLARIIDINATGTLAYTAPVIQALSPLKDELEDLIACTKVRVQDCSGALDLYHKVVSMALTMIDYLSAVPGANVAALSNVTTILKGITGDIDTTISTKDASKLVDIAKRINTLIGLTAGNRVVFADISNVIDIIFITSENELSCIGLDITQYIDVCSGYLQRLQGMIASLIPFMKNTASTIPTVGPYIATSLISALQNRSDDLQKGTSAAINSTISLAFGIQQLMTVLPQTDPTVQSITAFLNNVVGILTVSAECGGYKKDCFGIISILKWLISTLLDKIYKSDKNLGPLAANSIRVLTDGFFGAVDSGDIEVTKAAYSLISGITKIVKPLPVAGEVTKPLYVFANACKLIMDCMIESQGGTETPTSSSQGTANVPTTTTPPNIVLP